MADRMTITIDVVAEDRTSRGLKAAQSSLSAFERSCQRTEQQLQRLGREHEVGIDADDNASEQIELIADEVENLDEMNPQIEAQASNAASQTLDMISDQVEALDGANADVDVGADDSATPVIDAAEDTAEEFDGTEADAEISVDDSATQVVDAAADAVENFDGQTADAEINADDSATPVVNAAEDAVDNFDGTSADAELSADDSASPIIDSVEDKAAEWDGSEYNARIGIIDAATAPITSILGLLKNPVAQGASLLGMSLTLADSANTFEGFESIMSNVEAISGATKEEMEQLTVKAQELGATSKFTAAESASAFSYMSMAGWKTQDMLGGIEGIMNLAAAAGEDLATTSDIVTDAITAFGLKASDSSHFADVLAQASANANTNVSMLGESFKYIAPVAGALKYSVEDTSLALGLMANASVKGSMSGTALKTALVNMASPTDTMAIAMDKYNISLLDSAGNSKSLKGVLDNLRSSLGGLSETEQTAAASAIFGKEAMAGMLAIINASEEDYNKLTEAVYNADGASQQMADTMLDNVQGSLTLLSSGLDEVKLTLGKRVGTYLKGAAKWLTDEMPDVKNAVSDMMDWVDMNVLHIKENVGNMMSSDEWKNANFFEKIDISWDKLIATPFLKWARGSGKQLMSKGISSLFSEASKILPGGEQAGLMSWISTGIIAKGVSTLVSESSQVVSALAPIASSIKGVVQVAQESDGILSFGSNLLSMIPTAGKVGLAAGAIVGGILAINAAIDAYNEKQISDSLERHMGDISLSAEELQELAGKIISVDWLVDVNLALDHLNNADKLAEEAEAALQKNDTLEWKSRVGIELTADEKEDYTSNIETFVQDKIDELEDRTYFAQISVETVLGDAGSGLSSKIQEWYIDDNTELTGLSESLTALVQEALEDGMINVEEQAAIDILQQKINNVLSGWKEAEAQAKWDLIDQKYGKLSGTSLDTESFKNLVSEVQTQRTSAYSALDEQSESMYSVFNGWENSGKISASQNEQLHDLWSYNYKNLEAKSMIQSLGFEGNTLSDAYGDVLQTNYQKMQENTQGFFDSLQEIWTDVQSTGNRGGFYMNLMDGVDKYIGSSKGLSGDQKADFGALKELYESMKPDVESMAGLIDSYREAGLKTPQTLMDAFYEAAKIGAASGDESAAWQVYANDLLTNGSEEIVDILTNENNPMYETLRGILPEEMTKAIDRATQETTASTDLSELFNKVLGSGSIDEIDLSTLKELCDKYGLDISDYLETVGIDVDAGDAKLNINDFDLGQAAELSGLTATGNSITLDGGEIAYEYRVNVADTLSDIAAKAGVALEELEAANQELYEKNGSWDLIYEGDLVYIPQVNAEETQAATQVAIDEAIQQATSLLEEQGDTAQIVGTDLEVTFGEVSVNQEDALEKVADAVGITVDQLKEYNGLTSDAEVNVGMKVRIPTEMINVDTTQLKQAVDEVVQEASNVEPASVDTNANVDVYAAGVDTSSAYDSTQQALNTAFQSVYDTTGSTDITINKEDDNISEVHSQVGSELRSAFSSGYSVSTNADIHVNYRIANPTANIRFGGGGTGISTISAAFYANGSNEVGKNGPEFAVVGEEGLEYIIPTVPSRRSRGIELWYQAGETLGMFDGTDEIPAYANGGAVGGTGISTISAAFYDYSDYFGDSDYSEVDEDIPVIKERSKKEKETIWTVDGYEIDGDDDEGKDGSKPKEIQIRTDSTAQPAGSNIEVKVDLAPTIKIEGSNMDENKIFEIIKSRCRELADDIGGELADKLAQSYSNMPLTGET